MILTCTICPTQFERPGTRGPIPQFCSLRCKGKRDRQRPGRKEYEREYRRAERAAGKRADYEYAYNRRPEVRERGRLRAAWLWMTSPEYREKQYARRRDRYAGLEIPQPYTGHRWLQMAREMVGAPYSDVPWAEDRYDEMGEAVLALLEGRDMKEAIIQYRKQEYVTRHLTIRVGDWGDDEEGQNRWFERVMPKEPSAEETFFAQYPATRYRDAHTKNRNMKHKTQQPRRRRQKDAGWEKYA